MTTGMIRMSSLRRSRRSVSLSTTCGPVASSVLEGGVDASSAVGVSAVTSSCLGGTGAADFSEMSAMVVTASGGDGQKSLMSFLEAVLVRCVSMRLALLIHEKPSQSPPIMTHAPLPRPQVFLSPSCDSHSPLRDGDEQSLSPPPTHFFPPGAARPSAIDPPRAAKVPSNVPPPAIGRRWCHRRHPTPPALARRTERR